MKLLDEKIKKILIAGNYVSEEDIENLSKSHGRRKGDFVDFLLSEGIINKNLLGQAIAEHFGLIYADLDTNSPTKEEVLKIPKEVGVKNRIVLFHETERDVIITTDSPEQKELEEHLRQAFPDKSIKIAYSLPEQIDFAISFYRDPLQKRFENIINKTKRIAPEVVIEIIDDAIIDRASDIHFEPQEDEVLVRIRIDGVLHEAGKIEKQYYDNILNLIKVNSNMRIDEHQSAQDGSMRIKKGEKTVDLRVSVMPTLDGEKVTIRILSEYVKKLSLSEIGLSIEDQELLAKSAAKPFGMIVVTGPTGAGKTSTLYAALRAINRPEVNITTIEDPVEYKIKGINHIQVNPRTNLTFAKGLRAIVRQDPDVILVGEIRDEETAEIAVNAALTGHLLLSTFHANDAATAIPRLLDMGIESFLLSSTLELVIAQRLVRKICNSCRVSYKISHHDLIEQFPSIKPYFHGHEITLYKGKGCSVCGESGYNGRTAIFEFIEITREMRDLILTSPSSSQVIEFARKQGYKSLFEDGLEKVKNGFTTVEELLRVAQPPEEHKK